VEIGLIKINTAFLEAETLTPVTLEYNGYTIAPPSGLKEESPLWTVLEMSF